MIKCMMYCEEKAVAKSILSTYEVKLTTGIKIVTKYWSNEKHFTNNPLHLLLECAQRLFRTLKAVEWPMLDL